MRTAFVFLIVAFFSGAANAAIAPTSKDTAYKGIWVSTPFPSFNAAAGQPVTLDLTVHNSGLPPQRVELGVKQDHTDWTAAFVGQGKRVESVFVAPDGTASVKLRLEPLAKTDKGHQHLIVLASGNGNQFKLPIDLTVGDAFPPKLILKPELPALRGAPDSDFDFKVAVENDGGQDATIRMVAATPPDFRVRITEQYGSQELTSLPLKVGEKKTVSVKITPSYNTQKGTYPIALKATTGKTEADARLSMEVTGEPKLSVSGVGERLSTSAEAGKQTEVDVVLKNDGSAPARDINLNASPPSGWKVAFMPARLDALEPDKSETVRALITPSDKAIAGDYMVKVSADGHGVSKSNDFRVTVRTSTMWGMVGILVIAMALVVLVMAMLRFGRR